MKLISKLAFAALLVAASPQAHALELGRHIANADTYVTSYAPRLDESKNPTGFFVERHYNFALSRLTERFYGEGSLQLIVTPFKDFDAADGSNYVLSTIKPAACEVAREKQEDSKDAAAFLKQVCGEEPKP